MNTAALLALWMVSVPGAGAQTGHGSDSYKDCLVDVKDDATLIKQGFFWVKDLKTADRLTGLLMAHVVAAAADAKDKNVCKALDRIAPAFKYEKEIGTAKVRCDWLEAYANFWWEAISAQKGQKKFPACEAYLDKLAYPAKFFDLKAKAPRPPNGDPANDGGFWNMCSGISDHLKKGSDAMCEDRVKHFFGPQVPPETGMQYCREVAKLWAKGDAGFCSLLPKEDDKCAAEAALTRAFAERANGMCPPGGPERGLCQHKLGNKDRPGAMQTWQQLQHEFCTERASMKPEELKSVKRVQQAPKQEPKQGP